VNCRSHGRASRCGRFDAVAARFSTSINGFTGAAVTRLDVLSILPGLKICVGYEVDGSIIDYFPGNIAALERCKPVYEDMPGWQVPIDHIREYEQLPTEARRYLDRLEELIGCPIDLVSVGAHREQTIFKKPIMP